MHKIDRRIPLNVITGASLSPFVDNYVILHANPNQPPQPPPEWDVVIETDFKTELVAWLSSKGSLGSNVSFTDKVVFFKKGKSKKSLTFVKDERFKPALFKADKVFVPSGLPASSQPARTKTKMAGVAGRKIVNVEYDPDANKPAFGGNLRKIGPRAVNLSNEGAEESSAPVSGGPKGAPSKFGGPKAAPSKFGGGGGPAPGGPKASPSKFGGPPAGGAGPARGGPAGGGGAARGAMNIPMGAPGGGAPRGPGPVGGGAKGPAPGMRGSGPIAKAAPKASAQPKCKAMYYYDAVQEDELTFKEGDIITIIEKDGDWWTGQLNGVTGLFPANFVQEI